jgi:hypothetical protein
MIDTKKVNVGDTILIKSLIVKRPVTATVVSIADEQHLYVSDSPNSKIRVNVKECWYDTEANRDKVVNKHPY